MKEKKGRLYVAAGAVAGLLAFAVFVSLVVGQWFENTRRADAEVILQMTRASIEENLIGRQNQSKMIAEHIGTDIDDVDPFDEIAQRVLANEYVSQVYLVKETTVIAVADHSADDEVGKDLSEFPYVLNIAKLRRTTTVEGPTEIVPGQMSFLFVQPILSGEEYLGEVLVVADSNYIIEEWGLSSLKELGYDYELWRIDSQDGEKRMVTQSDPDRDMSDAQRTTFFLPTEWVLSIEPERGWITWEMWVISTATGLLALSLLFSVCSFLSEKRNHKQVSEMLRSKDMETGIYNSNGYIDEMKKSIAKGLADYTQIILVMDEYIPLARVMTNEQKEEYRSYIVSQLKDCMKEPHIYARAGESTYVVAVLEKLTESQARDMAKELSLSLLWKTEVDEQRKYIHAKWSLLSYPDDGTDVERLLTKGMRRYEEKDCQERTEEL